MAFTERDFVDQMSVDDLNYVFVRLVTVVEKDGTEVSRSYHRASFEPGTNLIGEVTKINKKKPEEVTDLDRKMKKIYEDPKVKAICAAAWAPR